MDNTIVDYDKRFHELVATILPPEVIQAWDKTNYWIEDSFPKEYHQAMHDVIASEGFFLHMLPKPGALEAIQELVEENYKVKLCTTPHPESIYCIDEKKKWVDQYLGPKFVGEMVFSHDKTEVDGHILIDDRDDIISSGKHTPKWKQVLFDASYNQKSDLPHRLKGWSQWREVIEPLTKKNSQ